MTAPFRQEVLKVYKLLQRTRTRVFKDDAAALEAARKKINEEFKKNKSVTDPLEIQGMLKLSREVESVLRTKVVQAFEKEPGVYELKMRPEVDKLQNVPYEGPTVGAEEIQSTATTQCCQDQNVQKSQG